MVGGDHPRHLEEGGLVICYDFGYRLEAEVATGSRYLISN
jgi:hypothetical protein